MQFLILATAVLGLAANAAVIDAVAPYASSPIEVEKRSDLQRRADIASIDAYSGSGCGGSKVASWGVPSGAKNGCWQLNPGGGTVASVRPNWVSNGCAVTIYTDSTCSFGATLAPVGTCTSGTWRTFSVDGSC